VSQSKSTTRYTITAAHRITGKSRTTLQRHIKQGKLSTTHDDDGNKLIDASELIRVYGDDCDFSREEGGTGSADHAAPQSEPAVLHRLASVQQQLDLVQEERRREREQLQSQITQLQETLRLAQEGHNKAMLLLQDRSGGGDWQRLQTELEERLADKLTAQLGQLRDQAEQEAIEQIKDLPWWRVVFR
jgi:hypothetical protein